MYVLRVGGVVWGRQKILVLLAQLVHVFDCCRRRRLDDRQIEPEKQPRTGGQLAQTPRDHFRRFAHDLPSAIPAIGPSDPRV